MDVDGGRRRPHSDSDSEDDGGVRHPQSSKDEAEEDEAEDEE